MRPVPIGEDIKTVRRCINDGTLMTRNKTHTSKNPHSGRTHTSEWVCPLCGHTIWDNPDLHREIQWLPERINKN